MQHPAPQTPVTPACAVWLNNYIQTRICEVADSDTLAKIIRLDQASFAVGVRYLWESGAANGGCDEDAWPVNIVEQCVEGATNPDRYAAYLHAIRTVQIGVYHSAGIAPLIHRFPNLTRIVRALYEEVIRIRRGPTGRIDRVEFYVRGNRRNGDSEDYEAVARKCRARVPAIYPIEVYTATSMLIMSDRDVKGLAKGLVDGCIKLKSVTIFDDSFLDAALESDLLTIADRAPSRSVSIAIDSFICQTPHDISATRTIIDSALTVFGKAKLAHMRGGPTDNIVNVVQYWLDEHHIVRQLGSTSMRCPCPTPAQVETLSQLAIPSHTTVNRNDWAVGHKSSTIHLFHDHSPLQELAERRDEVLLNASRWIGPRARACLYIGGPTVEVRLRYNQLRTIAPREPWKHNRAMDLEIDAALGETFKNKMEEIKTTEGVTAIGWRRLRPGT